MDLGLKDRVAVVAGASRGLGRATAQALLAEGAKVVAVARASEALASLAAQHPDRCVAFEGDLLDPSLPGQAVQEALRRFGRLDIAVVNTPGPKPLLPLEAGEPDFAAAFDSTFYPAWRQVRAAAEAMKAARWGRIVIVSSTSVKAPKPFLCLSAAARSALWAWAKSAAPELYAQGITINALFAGPHDTDRARQLGVKDKVIGRPDDFGRFVASLCGDATRFITGAGYMLDGGESPAP
ncbi:SDR family NAD(P)-dependent oxidoreductase [Ramlibacter rhizophilus]|nr:SDR family NAD(P)-dependent oxidoreductase [Ramlibacter rhizophilus]